MSLAIERIESPLFNGAVADEIAASLSDAIADRGRATLVLAGGSTPSAIYRLLALPPRVHDIEWSKVVLYFGDERFVPQSDGKSNFKMVHDTLLHPLGAKAPRCISVDTTVATPTEAARAYAEAIIKEEKLSTGETPVFDLVLLGVGEDGHTASLFPHSPLLNESQGIAAAATHPSDGTERVTILPEIIRAARRLAFVVKGESKSEIVQRVLEGAGDVDAYPANLYRSARGAVTWFLDSAAAVALTPTR
jgi:6-phosphogluconolactonase